MIGTAQLVSMALLAFAFALTLAAVAIGAGARWARQDEASP